MATDDSAAWELLQIEEADAWFEYREATQGHATSSESYWNKEDTAFGELQERLQSIKIRRETFRPKPAARSRNL